MRVAAIAGAEGRAEVSEGVGMVAMVLCDLRGSLMALLRMRIRAGRNGQEQYPQG